jgi:hypothetical protein
MKALKLPNSSIVQAGSGLAKNPGATTTQPTYSPSLLRRRRDSQDTSTPGKKAAPGQII